MHHSQKMLVSLVSCGDRVPPLWSMVATAEMLSNCWRCISVAIWQKQAQRDWGQLHQGGLPVLAGVPKSGFMDFRTFVSLQH